MMTTTHRRTGLVIAALSLNAALAAADEIPAGTVLHIRLQQRVSSFGTPQGAHVDAIVIAPIEKDGRVLIPLGAQLLGEVDRVRRVGLGLSRETALVGLTFNALKIDGAAPLARLVAARLLEIDNARETIDKHGQIRGIRATASFSSMLSGFAVSAGALDPMLLGFTASSSLSVFRIPESEIILPAGTELKVRLEQPLEIPAASDPIAPSLAATDEQRAALSAFVRTLPFRTATEKTNLPSDVTNLVFLGSREAIARVFNAAGWGQTDPLSSQSTYAALRAVVENQGYREAPMSVLTLGGRPPTFTYAKTLNTFFKRHHLRIFGELGTYDGLAAWTSSSTHDSGIGFATRSKSFIHVIDQNIDEERNKVVYDVILTGCADAVDFVDRPWVPRDAQNATGDALLTDGRIAVVKLNACETPQRADAERGEARLTDDPGATVRVARNTILWLKNDAFRGNIIYQGYSGVRLGLGTVFKKHEPTPERAIHFAGEEFKVVAGSEAAKHELAPDDNPDDGPPSFETVGARVPTRSAPILEFSVSGGYAGFGNEQFSTQVLTLHIPDVLLPSTTLEFTSPTELKPRGGFSVRTTVNTSHRLSHEVGYTFNKTVFTTTLTSPTLEPTALTSDAQIRQFHYNLLVHLRPNRSPLRPYVAVGPAFQLIRIGDPLGGTIAGTNRSLHLPFRELSLLEGAWDFGSAPPLEGGGVFQLGLQYGAGLKLYASRHYLARIDFRETLSPQPDFWSKSYDTIRATSAGGPITFEPGPLVKHGALRHQLLSVGFGVTF
jgi:LssY-like putative type I secretion system component LssY